MSTSYRRKQLLIDPKVQGALLGRVAAYWGYCLLSVVLMLTCWMIAFDRPTSSGELIQRIWYQFGPALMASVVLIPVVMLDFLRLSNRFAGPMYRLRRAMRQMADGHEVDPVYFRDGDYWCDFADDFNRLVERVCPTNDESDQTDESATVGFSANRAAAN